MFFVLQLRYVEGTQRAGTRAIAMKTETTTTTTATPRFRPAMSKVRQARVIAPHQKDIGPAPALSLDLVSPRRKIERARVGRQRQGAQTSETVRRHPPIAVSIHGECAGPPLFDTHCMLQHPCAAADSSATGSQHSKRENGRRLTYKTSKCVTVL